MFWGAGQKGDIPGNQLSLSFEWIIVLCPVMKSIAFLLSTNPLWKTLIHFFVVIFFAVRFLEFFLLDLGTSTFNEILVVANTIDIYQEILFP